MAERIDWEMWAPRVIAGDITSRGAAREIGCSESAVRKAVKAWRKRNVSEQVIAQKTRAKLEKTIVDKVHTVAEFEDAIAARAAEIVAKHRDRIERTMAIVDSLTEDLTHSVVKRTRLIELIEANVQEPHLLGELISAVQVGEQAKAAGTLAQSLRTLIGLQRQAFELPAKVDADGKSKKGSKEGDGGDPYGALRQLLGDLNGADTGLAAGAIEPAAR